MKTKRNQLILGIEAVKLKHASSTYGASPQMCRKVVPNKKRGDPIGPPCEVMGGMALLNHFSMQIDVQSFDLGFLFDAETDDHVDNLEDDRGCDRGIGDR